VAKTLLIDTDVLIDYLRELPPAVDYLESLEEELCTWLSVVACCDETMPPSMGRDLLMP